MSGRIVHFEIPFQEGDRARSFYEETFGWNLSPMPEMDYTIVGTGPVNEQGMSSEPGYINGGMFERSDEAPDTPVLVVDVEDIDKTLEQIEQRGGSTISPRAPVGEMGWAAYFKDPEGNVMGLWQTAPQD